MRKSEWGESLEVGSGNDLALTLPTNGGHTGRRTTEMAGRVKGRNGGAFHWIGRRDGEVGSGEYVGG